MPDWLTAILLGLIEGLTEFIPVSSTGHLLIAEKLMHQEKSEMFNVVIQAGAALALIPVFWKKLITLATGLSEKSNRDLVMKLGVAFLITAVGGIIMKKMGASLDKKSLATIAWATLIGGGVIFAVEAFCKNRKMGTEVTWMLAVAFGIGQLVAIGFPGASRSGSTIMLVMALGLARAEATEFSFLLGVPTLFAAAGKELLDAFKEHAPHPEPWSHVALGFIVSAVSAFLVVRWLLGFVRSHTFNGFAVYRLLLGAALLIWFSN